MNRGPLVKYLFTIVAGLTLGAIVLNNYGFYEEGLLLKEKLKIISDALTIPGTLILMLGLLCFLSSQGAFEGIGYAAKYALGTFVPFLRLKEQESYLEYKERRREKKLTGYGFLLKVGGAFLLASVIVIIIYYNI